MNRTIDDALEGYAVGITSALPDDVTRAIDLCSASLVSGPLYLTEDGDECSMFDEDYDHPHDWSGDVAKIGAALDWVGTVYIDEDGDLTEREPQGEHIEGEWCEPIPYWIVERRQVVAAIVGRELAAYV